MGQSAILKSVLAAALLAAASAPALAAPPIHSGGANPYGPSSKLSDSISAAYSMGARYLETDRYRQAQEKFSEVLDFAARDANTNYLMGLTQIGLHKPGEAQTFFETAVRIDGDFAQARGWLGAVEMQAGHLARADAQKAALLSMKAACAGACPRAGEIDIALARIASASPQ